MRQTVLLLDGSIQDREQIKRALRPYRQFAFTLVIGPDHYDYLEESLPEVCLILMDIAFPDTAEGFGILRKLRNNPRYRSTPLIIVSGRDDPETRKQAQEYAIADFISKPFADERLLSAVQHALRRPEPSIYRLSQTPSIHMSPAEYTHRELRVAQRSGAPLSFVVICPVSLDGRAPRHEALPEDKRDQIDQRLPEELCALLRSTDVAFLNDNGDILVVLPATSKGGALRALDKITAKLRGFMQQNGIRYEDYFYAVAVTYPADGENIHELMDKVHSERYQKEQLERQSAALGRRLTTAQQAYSRARKYR